MHAERLRIVIAGGGTGGHLFPAIAIADEIRKIRPDAEITFVGTKGKIEARVVPERGFGFAAIWISGLRRKLAVQNLLFPLKVCVSLVQSYMLMRRLKPDVVVGTGGYVCGPVVYVASLLGIPTLIQEQNSYPGVTTRLLASRVDEVHISLESSARYLRNSDRIRLSGNPTRAAIGTITRSEGARYCGIDGGKRTLLVFGGSLGAGSLNSAMGRVLRELCTLDLQILWQTGDADYERALKAVEEVSSSAHAVVKVSRFIDAMEYAYAVADLAVCRAGATTVAELTRAGVPSVLVPYPFAAADHQTENAKTLVEKGAAVMIRDNELGERLFATIAELMRDSRRREEMAEKARALGRPDATARLAQAVLHLAGAHDAGAGKDI